MNCYVGLGGNIGDSFSVMEKSLQALSAVEGVWGLEVSRPYITTPVSPIAQREYLNAVCRFETTLSPFELLAVLEKIEKALGKRPKPKEAPRVIDLDLIFYGDCQINSPKLTVPHPRWNQRLFVLAPLAELTGMKSMPNTFGHEKVTPLTRKFCI